MGIFLHRSGFIGGAGAGGGGAPAAWTPAELFTGGEGGAWYDISDTSTLWQDTGGTTAVTADGQSVARVDDKSPNGRNLLQATAANRPVYRTSGGLHWLEFDGSNDYMATTSAGTDALFKGAGSSWAMYETVNAEANGAVIGERRDDATDYRHTIFGDTRSSPNRFASYRANLTGEDFFNYGSEQAPGKVPAIFSHSAPDLAGYDDNTVVDSGTSSDVFPSDAYFIDIGALVNPSAAYLDGYIYACGIIDRVLIASERADLNTWLKGKAGL